MLVIGFTLNNEVVNSSIDEDVADEPARLHKTMCQAYPNEEFRSLLVVENETVVAEYYLDEDYGDDVVETSE